MHKEMPLGKKTDYVETYSPELLFPIPRALAREKTGIQQPYAYGGKDIWNGFELSWLNKKGKPEIALAEFIFPCSSPFIIESKSFKLYLNSFNQSHYSSHNEVLETLKKDLSDTAQAEVQVKLYSLESRVGQILTQFAGTCLDNLDIATDVYQVDAQFLSTTEEVVQETLYSNLLKSNCMATGQPDWGSLLIRYKGKKIEHEGLLKYIISYRGHIGFAEHCVEQMFQEIMHICQPEHLTVYARYTRRGGLDINPYRSNFEEHMENQQHFRQ
ncbi:NADPH-dependent 7-cyano-7-deazaguanine reductase [Chlamydiales bacterium STE3]|nr:NADPH-dependent 7-cyano-7-deazaguanine reductase [Chlamydiales bacterium STE3]